MNLPYQTFLNPREKIKRKREHDKIITRTKGNVSITQYGKRSGIPVSPRTFTAA